MRESDHHFLPFVRSYDKRLYFVIGLGSLQGKIVKRSFADTLCILFQHIQNPVWIMIPIFVVNNGNLNGFDLVIAGRVRLGIIAKFHAPVLLSCPFGFQDADIVIGFPKHMVCQKGKDNRRNLSA